MTAPAGFTWPPTPTLLQWLSGGQWANRLLRSQRFYGLLHRLYHPDTPLIQRLPHPFRYQDLAQVLFAPGHSSSETAPVTELLAPCQGSRCLCQQTGAALLLEAAPSLDLADWLQQAAQLTRLDPAGLASTLELPPFAVVHRALREDLKQLTHQGWLKAAGRGQWEAVPAVQWPTPPDGAGARPALDGVLSPDEWLLVLRSLDSVAFVHPQLDVILDKLWRQAPQSPTQRGLVETEPMQRIFTHLDYILPDAVQEQVDTYQQQIEALWSTADGGVIQFENWSARTRQSTLVTVYPVCLHYARRAKYLSAYGLNPTGQVGWYNYRLDRILSPRLTILPWGDPQVPPQLKRLRHTGQLASADRARSRLGV